MYIGISSGDNAIDSMKRRLDDFKQEEGINEFVALYESSSQENTRDIERFLIEKFADH